MTRFGTYFLASALLLAGLSLKGEVLYWMVDDQAAKDFPFAYASVASSAGGYLPYVDDDGKTVVPEIYEFDCGSVTDGEGVYVDVAGLAEKNPTFRIELFNDAGKLLAYGDELDYAYLKNTIGAIVEPSSEKKGQAHWPGVDEGGKFTPAGAVPEPTSGLLLLMGLAGLALRRRRA